MSGKLDETLGRMAEEVFESLAFVLPALEDEPSAPPEQADMTAAIISFTGPFAGTLVLNASSELLPAIAANMLGLDFGEVASREMQRDAFKELANVICGNILPVIAGEQAMFDVAPAELPDDNALPATLAGHTPLATAQLHMEKGWVSLLLFAPQHVAAAAEAIA